jgi:hypothetical protein
MASQKFAQVSALSPSARASRSDLKDDQHPRVQEKEVGDQGRDEAPGES